jgi:hypothetical protein
MNLLRMRNFHGNLGMGIVGRDVGCSDLSKAPLPGDEDGLSNGRPSRISMFSSRVLLRDFL